MIKPQDLKTVVTTYEVDHQKWRYRLIVEDAGVLVKRVPLDTVLWSHVVLAQAVDSVTNRFISVCRIDLPVVRFHDLDHALKFINEYEENHEAQDA